ncbi:hypothetical protein Syun_021435 [Stephania yunnanensis]|uniref:Uncharacterized protein n=1 Tax=Stephania yunnanensis TaxID=152371 RepID=A0AAP0NPR5_9MAGN
MVDAGVLQASDVPLVHVVQLGLLVVRLNFGGLVPVPSYFRVATTSLFDLRVKRESLPRCVAGLEEASFDDACCCRKIAFAGMRGRVWARHVVPGRQLMQAVAVDRPVGRRHVDCNMDTANERVTRDARWKVAYRSRGDCDEAKAGRSPNAEAEVEAAVKAIGRVADLEARIGGGSQGRGGKKGEKRVMVNEMVTMREMRGSR